MVTEGNIYLSVIILSVVSWNHYLDVYIYVFWSLRKKSQGVTSFGIQKVNTTCLENNLIENKL